MLRLGGRDRRRRAAQLPPGVARAVVRRAGPRRRRRRDLRVRALRGHRPRPLRRPRPQGPPELRGRRRVRDPVRARRLRRRRRRLPAPSGRHASATPRSRRSATRWVDDIQIMGDAAHVRAEVAGVRRRRRACRSCSRSRGARTATRPSARRCTPSRSSAVVSGPRTSPCRDRARGTTRTPARASSVPNDLDERVAPRGRAPRRAAGRDRRRSPAWPSPIATTAPCAELRGPVQRVSSTSSLGTTRSTSPMRERLVGAHLPAAPDELLRARRPDQPGQALRAARAGDDAEQDLRLTDRATSPRRRAGRTRTRARSRRRARSRGSRRSPDAGSPRPRRTRRGTRRPTPRAPS